MFTEEKEIINYGDINPLEHGGIWLKQTNETEYEIIKNNPENNLLYDLSVNISDSWIEKEKVMSFIGMTEETFDPILFAIGCTDYYNFMNFGGKWEVSQGELINFLKSHGITIEC